MEAVLSVMTLVLALGFGGMMVTPRRLHKMLDKGGGEE